MATPSIPGRLPTTRLSLSACSRDSQGLTAWLPPCEASR
jgi:hypothetical protein